MSWSHGQKTLENVFKILRKILSQETMEGCASQKKRVKPRKRERERKKKWIHRAGMPTQGKGGEKMPG